jgi:CheY-like chemotaxis protein
MRVIRFLADDGSILLGEDRGDGTARVVIEPGGILTDDATSLTLPLLRGRHALVADDDERMRELVTAVLDSVGCTCTVCADGAEAMAAIERESLDLVVSDIRMPHHDGYEIFSAAREHQNNVPVVLITGFGYDPSHSLVRVANHGHSAVLYKPFSAQQLRDEVSRAYQETLDHSGPFLLTSVQAKIVRVLSPCRPHQLVQIVDDAVADGTADDGQGLKLNVVPCGEIRGPDDSIDVFHDGPGAAVCRSDLAIVVGAGADAGAGVESDHAVLAYTCVTHYLRDHAESHSGAAPNLCCLGPCLVTPDEFGASEPFEIESCIADREALQARVDALGRTVERVLNAANLQMPLNPGTIIAPGPAVWGAAWPDPPVPVRAGDTVSVRATAIGSLVGRIEAR